MSRRRSAPPAGRTWPRTAGALLGLVATAFISAAPAEPLSVGRERQLFVDDHLVASTENVRRVIHPVTKYERNPILVPDRPWEGQYTLLYGTVIREEEGVWKMWYSTMNHFRYPQQLFTESTYLCYATSTDGIRWDKPALGLIDYRGHKENNIVFQAHHVPEKGISGILDAVSILKDDADPDPSHRYKMMMWHHNQRQVNGRWEYHLESPYRMGHYVAFSPDGLRWSQLPEPVFPYLPVRDTAATAWDPRTKKYLAFVKQQVDGKRTRWISESDDFVHWTPPVLMLQDDENDPPAAELYHNNGFYYEGMFLGFMTVFHPAPKTNIYLDIQLISSRDGRSWQRVGDRKPFIPVGRRDIDWDFGFNNASSGAPVRVGDELWIYYSGRSYRHPIDGQSREPNKGAIGLTKVRLDGFVSMDAGETEGTLTTRPLRFTGNEVEINADASRGELRVEVVGEDGSALPGFSKDDGTPLRSDAIRHRVTWKDEPKPGQPVRFKFYLRHASLYSFSIP